MLDPGSKGTFPKMQNTLNVIIYHIIAGEVSLDQMLIPIPQRTPIQGFTTQNQCLLHHDAGGTKSASCLMAQLAVGKGRRVVKTMNCGDYRE